MEVRLRLNGYSGNYDAKVEQALRQAALWDEVKDKLKQSGLSLSGGQQQRLCIARAIAAEPSVLLMDEPCSALDDPIATHRIEELMQELKKNYTIAIVTHNLQQAKRVADMTAFLYVDTTNGGRTGYMVEYGATSRSSNIPRSSTPRIISAASSVDLSVSPAPLHLQATISSTMRQTALAVAVFPPCDCGLACARRAVHEPRLRQTSRCGASS